jgi:hypothetical protein
MTNDVTARCERATKQSERLGRRTLTGGRRGGGRLLLGASVSSVVFAAATGPGCASRPCEETFTCPPPAEEGGESNGASSSGGRAGAGSGGTTSGAGGTTPTNASGGTNDGQSGASPGGSSTLTGGRPGVDGGSGGSSPQAGTEDSGPSDDAGSDNSGSGACGPDNCAGCCASDGGCIAAVTPQACGSQGHACQMCPADQQCTSGACKCPGATEPCGNACIDFATSKENCGSCGDPCEAYQFCSGGKCLPRYVSTRVQPVTSGGDAGEVAAAAVFTDGSQDDLLLQLHGDLVLSAPGASMTNELHGSGFARYTPEGTLVWGRAEPALFGDQARPASAPVILANGDFAVGYLQYDPPSGPVAGTYALRVARVGGHTGNLVWAAKFPWNASSSSDRIGSLVALSSSQKLVSFTLAQTFSVGGTV